MKRTLLLVAVFTCAAFASASSKHMTHRPVEISAVVDSGCVLFLTDGSAWEIRQENRKKAAAWPISGLVGIYKINDRQFPYRLVLRPGTADGDVVSANRLQRIR